MSFLNITKLLHTVDVVATDAADIIAKLQVYVHIAEATGATGAQKLAAVKTATEGYISQSYPALVPSFDVLWTECSAFVTGLVSLYNALGVFKDVAAVVAAAPGVTTAIMAGVAAA